MDRNHVDSVNEEKNKEGEHMPNFKPIQATPELSGADARAIMRDLDNGPNENANQKNAKLIEMVKKLRN